MARPAVLAPMRQLLLKAEFLSHKSPILVKPLKPSDEIG
jgi:hypothetical protein